MYLLTRSNGSKLLEIIIDTDNPLFSLVIRMEEPYMNYRENWVNHALSGTIAIYEKYKQIERKHFDFKDMRSHLHLRLMNYEKNIHFLNNLPHYHFLDLAAVPVFATQETIGESTFSIMRNIQIGECQNCTKKLFQIAYENETNSCIIEPIEFSAEELGFETFFMSNRLHCATINRQSLGKLVTEIQNECLYLIPANIHEVLIIPQDNIFDVTELRDFSQRIIESLDTKEIFLSSNIYRYTQKSDSLEIISCG
ncbi:MAG: DUF5688 family protein [Ruminococcus flavefaciens]|nr:DUF5688 family protein [Ruminococcus flavefaciens]